MGVRDSNNLAWREVIEYEIDVTGPTSEPPGKLWKIHTGGFNMSEATPEFGGECAFAVSLGKNDPAQSGATQAVVDGKTYYFQNPVAKVLFKVLGRSGKAHENYNAR